MVIWQMNGWELIKAGGPIMYPIVLCSILALMIIVQKLMYFASIKTDTASFKQAVFDRVKANDFTGAMNHCDANPSPLAEIMKAGIVKFGAPRDEMKAAMEEASLFEIPKLEQHLSALATIAHVTPLLGLLGTVMGICQSFYTIQVKSVSLNPVTPADLAGGIWTALLTTVAGLVVAIPAFIAYNYFVQRVDTLVLTMEKASANLLNFLCQAAESHAARTKKEA